MKFLDQMIARIRGAKDEEEAKAILTKDYMGPDGEHADPDGDQHVHIHLERGGAMNGRDEGDPENPDGTDLEAAGGDDLASLAARVAKLEEMVAALADSEEEVELESPDTQDAKRYMMRRGAKIKSRDEDIPVPERNEEMIGETDLPGIEDLDARMKERTADQRRKARDQFLKTHDSADAEALWDETMAAAEIIIPGFKVPTFDARLPIGRTADRLCATRRRVMDAAMKNEETAEVIKDTVGAISVKTLTCDSLKMAFNATAAAIRASNNGAMVRRSTGDGAGTGGSSAATMGKVPTIAEIQKRNDEYWAAQRNNGATRR